MDNFKYINPPVYSGTNENNTQYTNRRFLSMDVVDAKYVDDPLYSRNVLSLALPPAVSEEEISVAASASMDFDYPNIIKAPDCRQLEIIGRLKYAVKVYLPMYYDLSVNLRECLTSSYSTRRFKDNDPHLYEVKDPLTVFPRVIINEESGTDGGCNMFGGSGCGKTTALRIVKSFYPQGIIHNLLHGGHFTQIVYICIDCPDGNVSELYGRIGASIDEVTEECHLHTYERMLKGNWKTTNSERSTILSKLVKSFGIGVILLDEAQNLNLTNKDIIEFLNISNTTNVSFMFISTEFLFPDYKLIEDNRKIVRRFGNGIAADRYCDNPDCFFAILYELSNYQLFVPKVKLINVIFDNNGRLHYVPAKQYNEVIDEIHRFSQGRIEQIIKLWIEMNKAYVEAGRTNTVDYNFVQNVIATRLYHQNIVSVNEERQQKQALQSRLRTALTCDGRKSFPRGNNLCSEADRKIEKYCEMANSAYATLCNAIGGDKKGCFDNRIIKEAVIRSTIDLVKKNRLLTEGDIRAYATALLTSKKSERAPTHKPSDDDEFLRGDYLGIPASQEGT